MSESARLPRWLARPASALYGAAVAARNRRFDRRANVHRPALPAVSVGNLTVGGTGKTPMTIWLARRLTERGLRPGVCSRGYGGRAGRGPLVVSDDGGPELDAGICGDEPWMIAARLPGVPVVVGSDRLAGIGRLATLGADCVLLDDGFQHRRVERVFDLVLLDAGTDLAAQRLLPLGRLREPLDSLARADAVVFTRADDGTDLERCRAMLRDCTSAGMYLARETVRGFRDFGGNAVATPARAVAFCGIAQPAAFHASLTGAGVDVVSFHPFRDHHPYGDAELLRLVDAARADDATLVTTEKDLARLGPRARTLDVPVVALRVETAVLDPVSLIDDVCTRVRSAAR